MTGRGMCTGAQSSSNTPCVFASGCKTLDMSLKMRGILSAEFHDVLCRWMRKDVLRYFDLHKMFKKEVKHIFPNGGLIEIYTGTK